MSTGVAALLGYVAAGLISLLSRVFVAGKLPARRTSGAPLEIGSV